MNPYAILGELIGLVAVVLIFGSSHVSRLVGVIERRAARKSELSGLSEDAAKQFEALRAEVARLRDTSTQYDISIQHTLEDLQQRVASLEARKRSAAIPIAEQAAEQAVGAGARSAQAH